MMLVSRNTESSSVDFRPVAADHRHRFTLIDREIDAMQHRQAP